MSALGEFEQLVLFAVLRLGRDASGVAIHDEILARFFHDAATTEIYTTLGRLEERGLVRAIVIEAATARVGRPRKHYELRPAGAKALRDSYANIQALAVGIVPKLNALAKQS